MQTSTVSAVFVLVGAGAVALAALEPGGGDNLALNGSDTLFEVTQAVIASCGMTFSDFANDKISFLGGGSGVGAANMDTGFQELSPMSRALKSTEYCTNLTNSSVSSTATSEGAGPTSTEALLVGIDGIAITANQNSDCQADTTANPTGAAIGLGSTTAFAVSGTGPCNGCGASNTYTLGDNSVSSYLYQNQPSFDALAIIYFGLTHDGFYNCNSAVRSALVGNWGALLNTSCTASGTTGSCPFGLQHAWRPGDLSGTADALVSVLNLPDGTTTNGKGAAVPVGIGNPSNVPNASQKSNPFCNSADATSSPATTSFGGSSDFSDLDPIRIECSPSDSVCQGNHVSSGRVINFRGDLGLVLPVLLPDGTSTVASDNYPTTPCGGGCALFPIARADQVGTTRCPSGSPPYAGYCFFPIVSGSSPPDPRCVAGNSTTCIDTVGKRDGRTYNLVTWAESANIRKGRGAPNTYQFAYDANVRFMNASFYRSRSTSAADPTSSGSGICIENDDILQIGCLADSNGCSIGLAGRASSSTFPDTGGTGTLNSVKALALNAGSGYVPPFTPASVSTDQDLYLENLLTNGGTVYPLARRLYVSTLYGTANMAGGEQELFKCYGTSGIANAAISSNGFVPIPSGPCCLDYPEANPTATPPPNVQGGGNVALPGCGLPLPNVDACQTANSLPLNTSGNPVPECP